MRENNGEECNPKLPDVKALEDMPEEKKSGLDDRDGEYTNLVTAYCEYFKKKSNQNLNLRPLFFYWSFGLLAVIIVGIIIICGILCFKSSIVALISTIITGFVSIVSTLLLLPKLIGEYLFPSKEDENIKSLIMDMRDHDDRQRESGLDNPEQSNISKIIRVKNNRDSKNG